jgi:hypothetical protein
LKNEENEKLKPCLKITQIESILNKDLTRSFTIGIDKNSSFKNDSFLKNSITGLLKPILVIYIGFSLIKFLFCILILARDRFD